MGNRATSFSVQPGWKVFIADLGLSPEHVLRLAGLPADLFVRRHTRMRPAEYFRLWRGLEQVAGADSVPLKIGQHLSTESFDPPIFASLCSPDLNTALQRLALFKPLIGPLTLLVEISAQQTSVALDYYGNEEVIPLCLGASELVFLTQLARLATRARIIPLRVELVDLPSDMEAYRQYFGVPVSRGAVNRLIFTATDAERPFLTENVAMWDFFEEGLYAKLADLDSDASMCERVRSTLREMLPAGQSSIDEVARRLAMSKRSIQRKLSDEASSYQDMLNAVRQEMACAYLSRSSASLVEIAYLLGFQDGNSFIRAFRSWTGQTPGEYRASALKSARQAYTHATYMR
ncbi:AraC family transcriptional regulator [Chloroflexia bacterium SDU3-3]|nr:AraC family transcriptional regulator [Chloroflexia bacterium SDU3-3]